MPTQAIGIFKAKTHLSELVEKARSGKHFIITKHGRPMAELGPAPTNSARPHRGMAKSEDFSMAPDFDAPLDDFAEYM